MKKLLWGTALLMLLVSLATGQTTLYTETFANGALQNPWYAGFNGNVMEVDFVTGNPSGDGWVGKLGNDISGGNVGQSFSGSSSWTDFYYEAQVYIPVTTNDGTYYGIEFRVDSVGLTSGYQFLARFRQGVSDPGLRFRARSEATPVNIRTWQANEIPGGIPAASGWHKMAVQAVGNQFWFYFDDQELPGNPYTDGTFSSGWIGAYVWDFLLSPISLYIDDIIVQEPTGIGDPQPGAIAGYTLFQNFPNPFNPSTTISFELGGRETVQLAIFNSLGQKIRTLASRDFTAGTHQLQWDGRDDAGQLAPAGVYFYRLQAGSFRDSKKMLLVK